MSMEPASSSSASSACSSDEDEEKVPVKPIQSLDDLPSDDSVSLASSTDEEEDEREDAAIAHSSSDDSSDSDNSEDDREDRSRDGDDNDDFEDHVPLEERVRQRREAGLSKKARADARERKSRALQVASQRLSRAASSSGSTTAVKKKSKHAPTEASSKRSDYYKRGAPQINSSGVGVEIGAHRYRPRDPRVTEHVDPGRVNDTFAFLQELRNEEISSLKKKVAVHKLPGKKGQRARRKMGLQQASFNEDQEELKRLLQEKATYERAQLDRKAKQAVKRKLNENRTAGKGVYHLKKREMKRLKLEAKFEEMRKLGGDAAVDKALAKRRKKNMSKDTGFMPRNL